MLDENSVQDNVYAFSADFKMCQRRVSEYDLTPQTHTFIAHVPGGISLMTHNTRYKSLLTPEIMLTTHRTCWIITLERIMEMRALIPCHVIPPSLTHLTVYMSFGMKIIPNPLYITRGSRGLIRMPSMYTVITILELRFKYASWYYFRYYTGMAKWKRSVTTWSNLKCLSIFSP